MPSHSHSPLVAVTELSLVNIASLNLIMCLVSVRNTRITRVFTFTDVAALAGRLGEAGRDGWHLGVELVAGQDGWHVVGVRLVGGDGGPAGGYGGPVGGVRIVVGDGGRVPPAGRLPVAGGGLTPAPDPRHPLLLRQHEHLHDELPQDTRPRPGEGWRAVTSFQTSCFCNAPLKC